MDAYQPYPEYKDSGIEWLGQIPAHWEVRRLKFAAPQVNAKLSAKPSEKIYLGLENIESGTGQILFDSLSDNVESIVATFQPGDILFGKLRPYLAKVIHADFDGVCTTELLVLRPIRPVVEGRFLFYMLLSHNFINIIDSMTYGAKMPRANATQIGNLPAIFPPLPEQRAIAAFLDRETAHIDTLIARKRELIDLLHRQRTAIISHAVTKGLDPAAPLKDSGIEWLGQIPAHWEVRRLKFVGVLKSGSGFPNMEQGLSDEDVPFYKVSDMNLPGNESLMQVHNNSVSLETARRLRAYIFPEKTIIFPKVGAALLTNKRRILSRPACIDNNTMGLAIRRGDYKFIFYHLSVLDFGFLANPGAVPSINESQVNEVSITFPTLPEQRAIAEYLDRETARIDRLIREIEESIALLQRQRTALISAAVTGKIDVREQK
jgi:type I restriction enzyme S subunit